MALINDESTDRYDLREFHPQTDDQGAPDATTRAWMERRQNVSARRTPGGTPRRRPRVIRYAFPAL